MKLTSKEALKMIKEFEGKTSSDTWIYHSICVGNSAAKIAEHLDLDVDKASFFKSCNEWLWIFKKTWL